MQHTLETIGYVQSPYPEKFAVPRQPGLVDAAKIYIELSAPYDHPDTVRGLDAFSHIWVTFIFHKTLAQGWKPLVRPPRLGGNQKVGVFATRSTFRPNALGLSVVKLEQVLVTGGKVRLQVSGADWVHGTPVVDIKPYVPYADSIADADGAFAAAAPTLMTTQFSAAAQQQLQQLTTSYPQLEQLITQVLAQDPRPAYKDNSEPDKSYGMTLYDLNIRWQVKNGENLVLSVG
ncbi:MAG: tRNA (N6-threonylcarbamoyladenosine(37)-N6)-methyltransferase TrmO [Idiomarina sp.]